MRWDHPELGPLSPLAFVPIAEESGLITQLTDFVLLEACRRLAEWHARPGPFASLQMHVNVSASDIAQAGFVSRVMSVLVQTQVDPRRLTLELTENILMERLEAALPALSELRHAGVGLSVDDFGTGYSSLRHLSSLPVNSLKVDRAFVADMREGSKEAAVVQAVVLLGRSLGKAIVAEGIETEAQMEQLRRMGCSTGQGFLLSHPLSPAGVDALLDDLAARTSPRTRSGRSVPYLSLVSGG